MSEKIRIEGREFRRHKPPRRGYSEEEIEKIKKLNEEGMSDSEIAKRLDRPQSSISCKRRELGLERSYPSIHPFMRKEEYDKAIEYIRDKEVVSKEEVMKKFDLTSWNTLIDRLRENEIEFYSFGRRTLDGIGSPYLFGDLAGKTYIYMDEEELEELIKDRVPDTESVRKMTDLLEPKEKTGERGLPTGFSKEEIFKELRKKPDITIKEWDEKEGLPHHSTIARQFGSWNEAKRKAGISEENIHSRVGKREQNYDR